jgi:hypothetical protein
MHRWLDLSRYSWATLIGLLAASATVAAWMSFGLINVAMANYGFVTHYGLLGLRDGGLVQMIGIGLRAAVVLAAYMLFKAVETELIQRWRNIGR